MAPIWRPEWLLVPPGGKRLLWEQGCSCTLTGLMDLVLPAQGQGTIKPGTGRLQQQNTSVLLCVPGKILVSHTPYQQEAQKGSNGSAGRPMGTKGLRVILFNFGSSAYRTFSHWVNPDSVGYIWRPQRKVTHKERRCLDGKVGSISNKGWVWSRRRSRPFVWWLLLCQQE